MTVLNLGEHGRANSCSATIFCKICNVGITLSEPGDWSAANQKDHEQVIASDMSCMVPVG